MTAAGASPPPALDSLFRPTLLQAWCEPAALRRLTAAVGAPLAYATLRQALADAASLSTLRDAARLQLLRSGQTRRRAAALLQRAADAGLACRAAGGLAAAWTLYANPSQRLLPSVDIAIDPARQVAFAAWLTAQGYAPARPLCAAVRASLWSALDPDGLGPLRPARGALRVRLLPDRQGAETETVQTPEGPLLLASASWRAADLAATIRSRSATPGERLRAVFDLAVSGAAQTTDLTRLALLCRQDRARGAAPAVQFEVAGGA